MKTTIHKIVALLALFAICNLSTAAQLAAFSIGEERKMGEKLLFSVRSSFDLIDDPDITQYINNLGQKVLDVTGVQYFDYHFFVINDKSFNAFAAPSGLIFFHSGLIGAMNTEDEFISVLAHEIGHIVKRHLASRVERGKYSSAATLGLALAAIAFGGAATPALLTGALATGQSINLHYSRIHEEEADLLAYDWMKRLNRGPEGQVEMLETMRKIARYRSDRLPQYLLTHPNPEARLHYIQSLVDIETVKPQGIADDFDFQRFKYRILSQVKDAEVLKTSLLSKIASGRSTETTRIMAGYGLSQIARSENDYSQGLKHLEKVIKFFPDRNVLLVDRGVIEFEAGRYEQAKRTLETALGKDRTNMYATFTLAKLMHSMGELVEAEKYLKIVTFELPDYSKPYYEFGKIASERDKKGEASFYLGKFYLIEGKLKFAQNSLRKALGDSVISDDIRTECKQLLKRIKDIQNK